MGRAGSRLRRRRGSLDHVVSTHDDLNTTALSRCRHISKATPLHGKSLQEHAICEYYRVDVGLDPLSFNRD